MTLGFWKGALNIEASGTGTTGKCIMSESWETFNSMTLALIVLDSSRRRPMEGNGG